MVMVIIMKVITMMMMVMRMMTGFKYGVAQIYATAMAALVCQHLLPSTSLHLDKPNNEPQWVGSIPTGSTVGPL